MGPGGMTDLGAEREWDLVRRGDTSLSFSGFIVCVNLSKNKRRVGSMSLIVPG